MLSFSVLVARKLVVGVSDEVRLRTVCSATEISLNIGILHASLAVIYFKSEKGSDQTARTGWKAPLLFTWNEVRF